MAHQTKHIIAIVLLISRSATADQHRRPRSLEHQQPRRLRYAPIPSVFEDSPRIDKAFGNTDDFAETEGFFRRLGGSMSMGPGDDKPNPQPPSAKPPPPTAAIPAAKPPTAKPPTAAKLPTAKPPTAKPVSPTKAPVTDPTEAPVVAPTEAPVVTPAEPSVPAPAPAPTIPVPDTPAPTSAPTPNCNLSPEERTQQITNILDNISSIDDLEDPSTPQGQAYQYIVTDDEAQVCPDDDSLIQRYVAATLYYSTEGDSWTECSQDDASCGRDGPFGGKDAFLSAGSECNWAGLSCNRNGELERIELYDNNLGGKVPSELGALLVVDTIELQENRITGTMPTAVCDNISPMGEVTTLSTDCGGENPLIECDCCTRCFRP